MTSLIIFILSAAHAGEIDPRCRRAGCSGERCVSKDSESFSTVCTYENRYSCYKNADCKMSKSGGCGWVQSPELKACLEKYHSIPSHPPTTSPLDKERHKMLEETLKKQKEQLEEIKNANPKK